MAAFAVFEPISSHISSVVPLNGTARTRLLELESVLFPVVDVIPLLFVFWIEFPPVASVVSVKILNWFSWHVNSFVLVTFVSGSVGGVILGPV